jgi:hypothetical protein
MSSSPPRTSRWFPSRRSSASSHRIRSGIRDSREGSILSLPFHQKESDEYPRRRPAHVLDDETSISNDHRCIVHWNTAGIDGIPAALARERLHMTRSTTAPTTRSRLACVTLFECTCKNQHKDPARCVGQGWFPPFFLGCLERLYDHDIHDGSGARVVIPGVIRHGRIPEHDRAQRRVMTTHPEDLSNVGGSPRPSS